MRPTATTTQCWVWVLTTLVMLAPLLPALAGTSRTEETLTTALSPETPGNPGNLTDLLLHTEASRRLIKQVADDLSGSTAILGDAVLAQELQDVLDKARQSLSRQQLAEARLVQLMDLESTLSGYSQRLSSEVDNLTGMTRRLESDLDQLEQESSRWNDWLRSATERQAPASLRELTLNMTVELGSSRQALIPIRDQLLEALTIAIQVRQQLEAASAELLSRRETVGRQLRGIAHEPLWALKRPPAVARQSAEAALNAWVWGIRHYLSLHAGEIAAMSALLSALTWFLFGQARPIMEEHLPYAAIAKGAFRVMDRPFWSIAVVVLLGLNFAPQGPIAYYDGLWLLLLLPVVVLTQAVRGPPHWVSVTALGLMMIPFPFRTIMEVLPWLDRWSLALQALVMAGAIAWDWRRLQDAWPNRNRSLTDLVALLLMAVLWVSAGANGFGHTGLARILVDGLLGTLGFIMVYGVALEITFALLLGLLWSPLARGSRVLRGHPRAVAYGLRRLLVIATTGMILFGGIYAFRIQDDVYSWLSVVWQASLRVGPTVIPVQSVILAVLILFGAKILMSVARVLLEDELLPRFRLSPGLPFAISTMARYVIAVAGLVLSLLALGVDLSKVSILAGALGVGVGFGLQNIFNNFISGIILLFERPVHVNDVIEIGGLRGAITRIGIRSSTVKTSHGAEVIVPNADLISKEVINWTLSDRRRRVEIVIGVAYGTPVERMLSLLLEIAGQCGDVLPDPEPAAMFTGFGENSLDFMLHAWIERYEDSLRVASDLRTAISQRLEREGIDIPFPQRDVHLHGLAAS